METTEGVLKKSLLLFPPSVCLFARVTNSGHSAGQGSIVSGILDRLLHLMDLNLNIRTVNRTVIVAIGIT